MMSVWLCATCQFPVSAEIGANLRYAMRQMSAARHRGAAVAHFPEGALSGYAGTDFESFAGFDWDRLSEATEEVARHARRLGMWVVTGSAHRLTGDRKPTTACTSSAPPGRSSSATTSGSAPAARTAVRVIWVITAQAATSACGRSAASGAGR